MGATLVQTFGTSTLPSLRGAMSGRLLTFARAVGELDLLCGVW